MNPLNTIQGTIIAGVVLAVVIALVVMGVQVNELSLIVWIHVLAGITWIGLLYYFNFVQVPALAAAAKDQGGPGGAGISKYVAPRALWWFRWGAVVTWLSGAAYLARAGLFVQAFTLQPGGINIGIGAWLGTIMLFNVWVLIWPNQKKILGLVEGRPTTPRRGASPSSPPRTNTVLSIPMLMRWSSFGHGGFFL
jgi:uncharacterized membrane protein